MNWLPSFLNPAHAAIAAAIVAPLLLLLYFLKLRRREMSVASTLLWKKSIQDLQVNSPFQRLRRNLLLLLQMLLLMLLALAFSRPVVNYTPGAGKLTVLLIDRSASMSANDGDGKKTRLEVAKIKAKEIVSSMDSTSSAAVIAFDDSAETVQTFTTDGALLRRQIDSIQPTDRRSKLKLAYQLAEAQSSFNPDQNRAIVRPDVFLFSDGRVSDAAELNINGNVIFTPIGSDTAGNIGVVALSAKRNYEQPTQVQIFARLANFGPKPIDSQVRLSVASIDPDNPGQLNFIARPGGFATTNLPPARWNDNKWNDEHKGEKDANYAARESVEFQIDLTTAAVIKVEQMNKDGDSLSADDTAMVVVPPPKQLSVLHVTDGQNPYLDLALSALNLQDVKKVTPEKYAEATMSEINADVIVFDRFSPKILPSAGSFIYFGCYPPADVKLQPVKQDGVVVLAADSRVVDWKRDHPILRGLSLSRVGAVETIKMQPTIDSTVLMDGVSAPMIILHREGRSTHLVVAFDVLQSNWPLMQSFPVFMQQAMKFMAIGSEMDVRESLFPGATPRIPRANLVRLGGEAPKSIILSGPGGRESVPVPLNGDFALPAMNQVGVYTLSPAVPQFERLAVNLLDDSESNLLPVITPPGNIGQAVVGGQSKSRLELWWWIVAAAALPLLLIEWWVYTRRVHL